MYGGWRGPEHAGAARHSFPRLSIDSGLIWAKNSNRGGAMNRFRVLSACLGPASLPLLAAVHAAPPSTDRTAFVEAYCVSCHGRARPAAGLAFDRLDAAALAGHEETWEK